LSDPFQRLAPLPDEPQVDVESDVAGAHRRRRRARLHARPCR
jgi:hypothetical protein